ncbi:DUF805 domain-containing protein [Candidatus Leptofilum sp.]|uniref:DUF805 domain-containing protein n=1 Tax=Candidatus Leptofilum sp. TaxID=3241576 RepID=UPI003B591C37
MRIDSGKVKRLRSEKNWSQEQLSEACGLSLRTVQRLESNSKASIESVRALADAFEIGPNDLIVNEDEEKMTPLDAVKAGFVNFANFSDGATRFEYWWFFLFALLVTAVATTLHPNAYQIVALILLVPFIAVGTRRLNDIGRSGWWQLLFLVPFGQIVIFYLLAQESRVSVSQTGGGRFIA